MRAIQAEFVARRGPPGWLWALLAVGLVAVAGSHWHVMELRLQREARQHEAQRMAQEASMEATRAAQTPLPYAESLANVRQMRLVAWPQMLAALEVTARGDLQLFSVEVDVAQQRAVLNVSAPSIKSVLDYSQTLQAGVPGGGPGWRFGVTRVTERGVGRFEAELSGRWTGS